MANNYDDITVNDNKIKNLNAGDIVAAALIALALFGAIRRSITSLLWHDELFTLYESMLPSAKSLWEFLHRGVESQTFGYLEFVRLVKWLWPFNAELGVRLPSVFAFTLFLTAIYQIARRYYPSKYALIAILVPIISFPYRYAYEARGYACLLCGSAFALKYYLLILEKESHSFSLLFKFWLSLLVISGSIYFGPFAFIPFGIAEIVYCVRTRKLRFSVFAALILGLLPDVLALPLVSAVSQQGDNFFSKPSFKSTLEVMTKLLGDGFPWIVYSLIAVLVTAFFPRTKSKLEIERSNLLFLSGLFSLIPIFFAVASYIALGGYVPRYVITTTLGLSFLFTEIFFLMTSSSRAAYLFSTSILVAGVLKLTLWTPLRESRDENIKILSDKLDAVLVLTEDEPIAVASGVTYLEINHYVSPELRKRFFFVTSLREAKEFGDGYIFTWLFEGVKSLVSINLRDFDELLAEKKPFLVYTEHSWLIPSLLKHGNSVKLIKKFGDTPLYRVEPL